MCKSAEANILYKAKTEIKEPRERDTHDWEEDDEEEAAILGPTWSRNLNAKAMKTKRHKVQNSELTMSLKAQGSLGRGSGSGSGNGSWGWRGLVGVTGRGCARAEGWQRVSWTRVVRL